MTVNLKNTKNKLDLILQVTFLTLQFLNKNTRPLGGPLTRKEKLRYLCVYLHGMFNQLLQW